MSKEPSSVLSLRVGGALRDRLERIRQSFVDTDQKRRLSDIARERLEQDQLAGEQSRDVYALLEEKEGTLRRLREKLDRERSLTRNEWSFLAHLAHDAYLYAGNDRSGYTSRLLADGVRAFGAVIALRDQHHPNANEEDGYYLGNLMYAGRGGASEKTPQPAVLDAVEYSAGFIEKDVVTQCGAEFLMRNLQCALRDTPRLPEAALDAALTPYKRSLFVLAAKGYSAYERINGGGERSVYIDQLAVERDLATSFAKALETTHYKLRLIRNDWNLCAALSFESANIECGLSFPHLEDLAMVVCHGIDANDYRLYPDKEWNTLALGGWRVSLRGEELAELTDLFTQYLEDEDVLAERAASQLIWGAL